MRAEYTAVVRPTYNDFYDKIDLLYEGIREMQGELRERSDNGESVDVLAGEIWDLFCSIS